MSEQRHLLTAGEAAEVLRLTGPQVSRLARKGVLPTVVLPGDELRFDKRDLWRWIDQQRQSGEEVCTS